MFVQYFRSRDLEVYDFRAKDASFNWRDIDPSWKNWDVPTMRKGLQHPLAVEGRKRDFAALDNCSTCILLLPAGNSSHFELGYAAHARKNTAVFGKGRPDLVYGVADIITDDILELLEWMKQLNIFNLDRKKERI